MAGSVKNWSDNNPPSCNADDLNGFKLENNNLIEGAGIVLDDSDNQQTHKAVSHYAGAGDFYNETGAADAYVLSVVGARVAPPVYADGMRTRFIAGNANTGASTINAAGLGVKNLVLPDGSALPAGFIVAGRIYEAVFDNSNNYFVIISLPQATETVTGGAEVTTQSEQEAGTLDTKMVTPAKQQYHPSAAKAWIKFDGTGTIAILDSYNVDSIVDNGTGDYSVNLTTGFSDTNYSLPAAQNSINRAVATIAVSTTQFDVITFVSHTPDTGTDAAGICVAAFGDQ